MVEGFVTPLGVHFLPDDRTAADRALMAGQSLVESGESSLRSAMASWPPLSSATRIRAGVRLRRRLLRRRTAGTAR